MGRSGAKWDVALAEALTAEFLFAAMPEAKTGPGVTRHQDGKFATGGECPEQGCGKGEDHEGEHGPNVAAPGDKSGWTKLTPLYEGLNSTGWVTKDKGGTWTHPDLPGQSIELYKDGTWDHFGPDGKGVTYGADSTIADALAKGKSLQKGATVQGAIKKSQEQKYNPGGIKVGDKVVTHGGTTGIVDAIQGNTVYLKKTPDGEVIGAAALNGVKPAKDSEDAEYTALKNKLKKDLEPLMKKAPEVLGGYKVGQKIEFAIGGDLGGPTDTGKIVGFNSGGVEVYVDGIGQQMPIPFSDIVTKPTGGVDASWAKADPKYVHKLEALGAQGWSPAGAPPFQGPVTFTHPSLPGQSIEARPDGTWAHYDADGVEIDYGGTVPIEGVLDFQKEQQGRLTHGGGFKAVKGLPLFGGKQVGINDPAPLIQQDDSLGSRLKDFEAAGGSNGAQKAVDDEGNTWFVKPYVKPNVGGASPARAAEELEMAKGRVAAELMANAFYKKLGIAVPETVATAMPVVAAGEVQRVPALATKGVGAPKGEQTYAWWETPQHLETAKQGFMADAFLGNWDVVGLDKDNMVLGADGQLYRVDNGSSLFFRAQGGLKEFTPDVGEVKSMLNPKKNESAASVFEGIDHDEMRAQAGKIADTLDDKTIDDIVDQSGFATINSPGYYQYNPAQIKALLKSRRDWMRKFSLREAPKLTEELPDAAAIEAAIDADTKAFAQQNLTGVWQPVPEIWGPSNQSHAERVQDRVGDVAAERMKTGVAKYLFSHRDNKPADDWADSSSSTSAMVLKAAAHDIWGGEIWEGGDQIDFASASRRVQNLEDSSVEQVGEDEILDDFKTYAKIQYAHTQQILAKDDREYVTLYRGMELHDDRYETGSVVKFHPGVLASFSTREQVARGFGQVVFKINVPKKMVFGTWQTGIGVASESEALVLGDKTKFNAEIVRGNDGGGYDSGYNPDEDNEDDGDNEDEDEHWKAAEPRSRRRLDLEFNDGSELIGPAHFEDPRLAGLMAAADARRSERRQPKPPKGGPRAARLADEMKWDVNLFDRQGPGVTRHQDGKFATGGECPEGGCGKPEGHDDGEHPPSWANWIRPSADAFIKARNRSSRAGFLSQLTPEDLTGHRLWTNRDGTVGVALDRDGDIQNVFNNGGPPKAAVDALLHAIRSGGRTLDCYDGYLPGFYAQFGFVETGRMRFKREYAPDGWDFERYGEPDVVFMAWKGFDGDERAVRQRARGGPGGWRVHQRSTKYYEDWDEAKADSRRAGNLGSRRQDQRAGVGGQARRVHPGPGAGAWKPAVAVARETMKWDVLLAERARDMLLADDGPGVTRTAAGKFAPGGSGECPEEGCGRGEKHAWAHMPIAAGIAPEVAAKIEAGGRVVGLTQWNELGHRVAALKAKRLALQAKRDAYYAARDEHGLGFKGPRLEGAEREAAKAKLEADPRNLTPDERKKMDEAYRVAADDLKKLEKKRVQVQKVIEKRQLKGAVHEFGHSIEVAKEKAAAKAEAAVKWEQERKQIMAAVPKDVKKQGWKMKAKDGSWLRFENVDLPGHALRFNKDGAWDYHVNGVIAGKGDGGDPAQVGKMMNWARLAQKGGHIPPPKTVFGDTLEKSRRQAEAARKAFLAPRTEPKGLKPPELERLKTEATITPEQYQKAISSPARRPRNVDARPLGARGDAPIWSIGGRASNTFPELDRSAQLGLAGDVKVVAELGGGISESAKVYFADGKKAVWKPAEGEQSGVRRSIPDFQGASALREAAAYDLAVAAGMDDMVPPTTTARIGGTPGSLQKWLDDADVAIAVDPLRRYDGAVDLRRAAAFDHVIGNTDRHGKNWMITKKGDRLRLIDHGLVFPEDDSELYSQLRQNVDRNEVIDEKYKAPWRKVQADWDKVSAKLLSRGIEAEAVNRARRRLDRFLKAQKWGFM